MTGKKRTSYLRTAFISLLSLLFLSFSTVLFAASQQSHSNGDEKSPNLKQEAIDQKRDTDSVSPRDRDPGEDSPSGAGVNEKSNAESRGVTSNQKPSTSY